ncbi:MAG: hypothetical protein E7K72_27910, partial [Roseomonas mucosa]|nr:hypothetical protein [Roseomonas mucosa]
MRKAIDSGNYGTDSANFTQGAAFRIQSLDHTLQATVQENKHFVLFNRMPKPKPGATVDEWTEQSSVGGFLGGSTNGETDDIEEATGEYQRRTGRVKYLMCKRQVSLVVQQVNNIVDAKAQEYANGAKQLLTDAEFLNFEGDEDVVPTEYSGIFAQMEDGINAGDLDDGHIIDLRGAALYNMDAISDAAAMIHGYGNWGTLTDIFFAPSVQSDFDKNLDPAFRVALTDAKGSLEIGAPVNGIRTSFGDVATNKDTFIRDETLMKPFEVLNKTTIAIAAKLAANQPSAVTAVAAANVSSRFDTGMDGNYYYLVSAVNKKGESTGRISAQVAVAVGDAVTLTITGAAGGDHTGYAIYRSRRNGTNDPSDFRLMRRIPKASTGNTVFVDLNRDFPGATKAYL